MLERATVGAGAEAYQLQRVFARPTKSGTQLCHGFWQHGASALDLNNSWPQPPQPPRPPQTTASTRKTSACALLEEGHVSSEYKTANGQPKRANLVASAFLLDFLYPSIPLAPLHSIYPKLLRRGVLARPPTSVRTKSKKTKGKTTAKPALRDTTFEDAIAQAMMESRRTDVDNTSLDEVDVFAAKEETATDAALEESMQLPAAAEPGFQRPEPIDMESLERLLDQSEAKPDLPPTEESFYAAWDALRRLGDADQNRLRQRVVAYLSRSPSPIEVRRCVNMIPQVPKSKWTNDFLRAVIITHTRMGNLDNAYKQWMSSFKTRGLTGGFEFIVSDMLDNARWEQMTDIWLVYSETRLDQGLKVDDSVLDRLGALPDMGKRLIAFEKWLASQDGSAANVMQRLKQANPLILPLRKKLAMLAIEEPCPPRQATAILEFIGVPGLWRKYLITIIKAWKDGRRSRDSTGHVYEIYNKYRQMGPDFRPNVNLFNLMFDFCWLHNEEIIYHLMEDWRSTHGLPVFNWTAYVNFLKFLARKGDIEGVERLNEEWLASFPKVRKKPWAWSYLLNAHAQGGNVAEVRAMLTTMLEEHDVRPDIDSWNALLKACVRKDDYRLVLDVFEEVRQRLRPNAWTYAIAMSISGRRGDLATTVNLFEQAQQELINGKKPRTIRSFKDLKPMVTSLVIAYCRNNELDAAETLLTDMSSHFAVPSEAWNELLRCHGKKASLTTCYDLMYKMRKHKAYWTNETYESLLTAMINARAWGGAVRLLRKAEDEKIFVPGPNHYTTVLTGLLRAGDYNSGLTVKNRMLAAGHEINFNTLTAIAEASSKYAPRTPGTTAAMNRMVESFRDLVERIRVPDDFVQGESQDESQHAKEQSTDGQEVKAPDLIKLRGHKLDFLNEAKSAGRALRLLIDDGEMRVAEQEMAGLMVEFTTRIDPEREMSADMTASILYAFFARSKNEEAYALWNRYWDMQFRVSSQPGGGIWPARRHLLCRPLIVMVQVFSDQKDGAGLRDWVTKLTVTGYQLSSRTWNIVIQALVRLGQWESAMKWCEDFLMPRWLGWNQVTHRGIRFRLELEKNDPSILIPSFTTMVVLQDEWLRLRTLAPWSTEVSALMDSIEDRFPSLHRALLKNSQRPGPRWERSPYSIEDFSRSIDALLNKLTKPELMDLLFKLRYERWALKQGIDQGEENLSSPFQIEDSGEHTEAEAETDEMDNPRKNLPVHRLKVGIMTSRQIQELHDATTARLAELGSDDKAEPHASDADETTHSASRDNPEQQDSDDDDARAVMWEEIWQKQPISQPTPEARQSPRRPRR